MDAIIPSNAIVSRWQPKDVAAYICARFSSIPAEKITDLIVQNEVLGMTFLQYVSNDWIELGFAKATAVGIAGLRDEIRQKDESTAAATVNIISSKVAAYSNSISGTTNTIAGEDPDAEKKFREAGILVQFGQVRWDRVPESRHVFVLLSRGEDMKNGKKALKKTRHDSQWMQMVVNHREIRHAVLSSFPVFTLPSFKLQAENKAWRKKRDKLVTNLLASGRIKPITWPGVSYPVPPKFVRETISLIITGQKQRLQKRSESFQYERNYQEDDQVMLIASSKTFELHELKFFEKLLSASCERPYFFASAEFMVGIAQVKDDIEGHDYKKIQIKIISLNSNGKDAFLPFENGNAASQQKINDLSIEDELLWPECLTLSAMDKGFDKGFACLDDEEDEEDASNNVNNEMDVVHRPSKKRPSDCSIDSTKSKHFCHEEMQKEFHEGQHVCLMNEAEPIGVGQILQRDPMKLTHGIPIGVSNVSLSIDFIHDGCDGLRLPFPPNDEVNTYGDLGEEIKQWIIRFPKAALECISKGEAQDLISLAKERKKRLEEKEVIENSNEMQVNEKLLKALENLSNSKLKIVCMVALGKDKVSDINSKDIQAFCKDFNKKQKNAFPKMSKLNGHELYKRFAVLCVKLKVVQISKDGWRTQNFDRSTVTFQHK